MIRTFALIAASFVAFGSSAQAQTINLSATDTTKASYDVTFQPGIYTVSLVDNRANGGFEAWSPSIANYGTPQATHDGLWTDYYDYTINGVTTRFNPFKPSEPRFADPDTAFKNYTASPQLSLNFTTATTVKFAIADQLSSFFDNAGGVSLSITSPAPEPATWAMMIVGFGLVGYAMRRRRSDLPSVSLA